VDGHSTNLLSQYSLLNTILALTLIQLPFCIRFFLNVEENIRQLEFLEKLISLTIGMSQWIMLQSRVGQSILINPS